MDIHTLQARKGIFYKCIEKVSLDDELTDGIETE